MKRPRSRIPLEVSSEFFVRIWEWLECIDLNTRKNRAYRRRELPIVSTNVNHGSHIGFLYPRLVDLEKFPDMRTLKDRAHKVRELLWTFDRSQPIFPSFSAQIVESSRVLHALVASIIWSSVAPSSNRNHMHKRGIVQIRKRLYWTWGHVVKVTAQPAEGFGQCAFNPRADAQKVQVSAEFQQLMDGFPMARYRTGL